MSILPYPGELPEKMTGVSWDQRAWKVLKQGELTMGKEDLGNHPPPAAVPAC